MSAPLVTLTHDDTDAVLRAVLHELHGPAVELDEWTATPLAKRGKRRVVRYELRARVAGVPDEIRRYDWVGKFYARPNEGRRVAALLRDLPGRGERVAFATPRLLAYDNTRGLLLQTYESGESVTKALARETDVALAAIGRALAVLHAVPVSSELTTDAHTVLDDLRPRVEDLAGRFPDAASFLRAHVRRLARDMPPGPTTPALLHGDLGTAQLLWRDGSLVILDFDDWRRGDPALDLATFLTQLRRLTLRKPGKLPPFDPMRAALLEAYRRWSGDDRDLVHRVAWYERATLLRKIHSLAFDMTRHPEAEALRQRQAEATQLLELCERDGT